MASNTGWRIVLGALALAGISVALIAWGRGSPTPITPASYQTVPLAVDPSAVLLYLDLVPPNEHGNSLWVLRGGKELGKKILTDNTIPYTDSPPSSTPTSLDPYAIEHYELVVKMLRSYSVDVDRGWRDGSQMSFGQVKRENQTIGYTVLQTEEHTYLKLEQFSSGR